MVYPVAEKVRESYKSKENVESAEDLQGLERYTIISAIDKLWQTHLTEMENLRQEVGLAGYGQKDPLIEFKQEAFAIFAELMRNINSEVLSNLFKSTQQLAAFEAAYRVAAPVVQSLVAGWDRYATALPAGKL